MPVKGARAVVVAWSMLFLLTVGGWAFVIGTVLASLVLVLFLHRHGV